MSSNEIETNNINGCRLTKQGPPFRRCSWQGNIGRHHANPAISKRRKWISQENKIIMEWYLLSEPKIGGYRKPLLTLWLQKGMFWISEQRLLDQANTIQRNSCMTELEIKELERKLTGSDSVIVEEVRSALTLPDHVEGRCEKCFAKYGRRNVPKKKLLEETAKVDKVLSKFKTHSITKTNELFYAETVVVINRLGVKIDKVAGRKKPREGCKIRLNSLSKNIFLTQHNTIK